MAISETRLGTATGLISSYQYEGLDCLTRLAHAKGASRLADFQYRFNAVNNIMQMTDGAGTHTFTYDSLDRLTAATHPSQANESYAYDDVGNRTASQQGSSYSYQPFNRLVTANGTSYGYDANGDLTSKTDGSGSWNYTWDFENRLKQAALSGGVTVNYSYDALGRRIQRSDSNGGTTKFVYDGADVVRDLNANSTTAADYVNGSGIDNKLRQTVSGTPSYFAQDRLGTTRKLTDSTGSVISNLNYDSFGNVVSGSALTRYSYTGRESDSDSSLVYYRARWYDSQQAKFISEDPLKFGGGPNFYAYVGNNPAKWTDPSGLERLQPYHLTSRPPTSCECSMGILGQAAQFSAGFGDTLTGGMAETVAGAVTMETRIPFYITPGWSPTGWIRGFTPGASVVDPHSGAYFAGQIGASAWGIALLFAAGGSPPEEELFIPDEWYAAREANRAPTEYHPYGTYERFDPAGTIKQVTTYDRYGCRARQFDIGPRARHGEGFHMFEYDEINPRQAPGGGRRSPQIPF